MHLADSAGDVGSLVVMVAAGELSLTSAAHFLSGRATLRRRRHLWNRRLGTSFVRRQHRWHRFEVVI